eukprot:4309267-Prymnesium_polylepis.1
MQKCIVTEEFASGKRPGGRPAKSDDANFKKQRKTPVQIRPSIKRGSSPVYTGVLLKHPPPS